MGGMVAPSPAVSRERRTSSRGDCPARVELTVSPSQRTLTSQGINISAGGICVRVEEMLEVRSLVQIHMLPEVPASSRATPRPAVCAGRVAWVVQRLDLRAGPPFLFDVGIEFVASPSRAGHPAHGGVGDGSVEPRSGSTSRAARHESRLVPVTVGGRQLIPRLEREPAKPSPWHLVVSVEEAPCFSGHYASERAALAAWLQFQRAQAARRRPGA